MGKINLGLIGKSLEHSFSEKYFRAKFIKENLDDYSYQNYELDDVSKIKEVVEENQLSGFNVTIPYKETIIPFLDELSETAKDIGAVNTVKVTRTENTLKLVGHNTDAFGFHQLIKPFFKSRHERILILGTGGASKAVAYLLKKQYGASVLFASRKPTKGNIINWEDMNENVIRFHKMIVNTTPLGMYPNENEIPKIPFDKMNEEYLLVDLIYNPLETKFLKQGKEKGAVTLNGLTMLHQQAEKSWRIWKK